MADDTGVNRCVAVLLCKAWESRERDGGPAAQAAFTVGTAAHHWVTTEFLRAVRALERAADDPHAADLYERVDEGVLGLVRGSGDGLGRLWATSVVIHSLPDAATTPLLPPGQAREFRRRMERVQRRRGAGGLLGAPLQVPPSLAAQVADGLFRYWRLVTSNTPATDAQILDVQAQIQEGMHGANVSKFVHALMRVHISDTGTEGELFRRFKEWRVRDAPDVAEWWPFEPTVPSLLYGLAGVALALLARVAARRLLPKRANSLVDRALGEAARAAQGVVQALLSWRVVGSVAAQLVAGGHVPYAAAAGLVVHATPRGLALPGVPAQHPITTIRGASPPAHPIALQLAVTFMWYISPLRGGFDGGVVECVTDTIALMALTTAVSDLAMRAGVWGSLLVLGGSTASPVALVLVGACIRGFVAERLPDPRVAVLQRRKLRALALGDREHDAAFASEAIDDPDGHGYRPVYIRDGVVSANHAGSLVAPLSDEDAKRMVEEIRTDTAALVKGLRQARRMVAGGRLDAQVTAASPCPDVITAATEGTAAFSGVVARRAITCLREAIAKLPDARQKKYLSGTVVGRLLDRAEALCGPWVTEETRGREYRNAKVKAEVLRTLMTVAVAVQEALAGGDMDPKTIRKLMETAELTLRRDAAQGSDWALRLARWTALLVAVSATTAKTVESLVMLTRDTRAWMGGEATDRDLQVVARMQASTVIPLLAATSDPENPMGAYVDPAVTLVLASRPVTRDSLRRALAGASPGSVPPAIRAYLERSTPELTAYGLAALVRHDQEGGSGSTLTALGGIARALLADLARLPKPPATPGHPAAPPPTGELKDALGQWIKGTQERLAAYAKGQKERPAAEAAQARQRSTFQADVVVAFMDPYMQLLQQPSMTAAGYNHVATALAVLTGDLFRVHPEALATPDAHGTFTLRLPPLLHARVQEDELSTSREWTPATLSRASDTLNELRARNLFSKHSADHTIGDGFVTRTAPAASLVVEATPEQVVEFVAAAPGGAFFSDLSGQTLVAPETPGGPAQVKVARVSGAVQDDWAVRLAAKQLHRLGTGGTLGSGTNPFGLTDLTALSPNTQGKLFAALLTHGTPDGKGPVPRLVRVPDGIRLLGSADDVVDGSLADVQKAAYLDNNEVVTEYACVGDHCFYKTTALGGGADKPGGKRPPTKEEAETELVRGNPAQALLVLMSHDWPGNLRTAAADARRCRLGQVPTAAGSGAAQGKRRNTPAARASQTAEAAQGRVILPGVGGDGSPVSLPVPVRNHAGIGIAQLAGATPEQALRLFGPLVRLIVGARVGFPVKKVQFWFHEGELRPAPPAAELRDLPQDGDVLEALLELFDAVRSPEARIRLIEEAHDAGASTEMYSRLFDGVYSMTPVPDRVRRQFALDHERADSTGQSWFRGRLGAAVFAAATRLRLDMGRRGQTRAAVAGQLCSRVFADGFSDPVTVCQRTAGADASTTGGATNFVAALDGLLAAVQGQSARGVQLAVTELDFSRTHAGSGRWRFGVRVSPVDTRLVATAHQHQVYLNALAERADELTEEQLAGAVATISRHLGPNFALPARLEGRVPRGRLAPSTQATTAAAPGPAGEERPSSLAGAGLPVHIQLLSAVAIEGVHHAVGALTTASLTDWDVRRFIGATHAQMQTARWNTPVRIDLGPRGDRVYVSKVAQISARDPDQSFSSKAEEELDALAKGLPSDVGVVKTSLVTLPAYADEKVVVQVSNLPVTGDQATAAGFINAAALAATGPDAAAFQDSVVSLVKDAKNRGYVLSADTLAVLIGEDGTARIAVREARFAAADTDGLPPLRDFAFSMPLDAQHMQSVRSVLGVDPEAGVGRVFSEGRVDDLRAAMQQPRIAPDGVQAPETFTELTWWQRPFWFWFGTISVQQRTRLLADRVQAALQHESRVLVPLTDVIGPTTEQEALAEWRLNPTLPGVWYIGGRWAVMLGPKRPPADGAWQRFLAGRLRADAIPVPPGTRRVYSDVVRPASARTYHQDLAARLPGIGTDDSPVSRVVSGLLLLKGQTSPAAVFDTVITPAIGAAATPVLQRLSPQELDRLAPNNGPLPPTTFARVRDTLAWLVRSGAGELANTHGLFAWLHGLQRDVGKFVQASGPQEQALVDAERSRASVVDSVGGSVPVLEVRVSQRQQTGGTALTVQSEDPAYLRQTLLGSGSDSATVMTPEQAVRVAGDVDAALRAVQAQGKAAGWSVGIAPGNIVYVGPTPVVSVSVSDAQPPTAAVPVPRAAVDQARLVRFLQRPVRPDKPTNPFLDASARHTRKLNGWLSTLPGDEGVVGRLVDRASADAIKAITEPALGGDVEPLAELDGRLYHDTGEDGKKTAEGYRFFTDRRVYARAPGQMAQEWQQTIAATIELLPVGAFPVVLDLGQGSPDAGTGGGLRTVLGYFVPESGGGLGTQRLIETRSLMRSAIDKASRYVETGGASLRPWHMGFCEDAKAAAVCGLPFPRSGDTPPPRKEPLWSSDCLDRPPFITPRTHGRHDEALAAFLQTEFAGQCFRVDHAAAVVARTPGLGGVTSLDAFRHRLASFAFFDSAQLQRGLACPIVPKKEKGKALASSTRRALPRSKLAVQDKELARTLAQGGWAVVLDDKSSTRVKVVREGDPIDTKADYLVFTDREAAEAFATTADKDLGIYQQKADVYRVDAKVPKAEAMPKPPASMPPGVLLWSREDNSFIPLSINANGCPLLFRPERAAAFARARHPGLPAGAVPKDGLGVTDGTPTVRFEADPARVAGYSVRSFSAGRPATSFASGAYSHLVTYLAEKGLAVDRGGVLQADQPGTGEAEVVVLESALRPGFMDVGDLDAIPTEDLAALRSVAARAALRERTVRLPANREQRAREGWQAVVEDPQRAAAAGAFLSALQSHAVERNAPQLLPVQFALGPDDGVLYTHRTAEDALPGYVDVAAWTAMPEWYPLIEQLEAQFGVTALFAQSPSDPMGAGLVIAGVTHALSAPRHRLPPMSVWISAADSARLDRDVGAAAGAKQQTAMGDMPLHGTLTQTGLVFGTREEAEHAADQMATVERMRAAAVNEAVGTVALTVVPPRYVVRPTKGDGGAVRFTVLRHDRIVREGLGYLRAPGMWRLVRQAWDERTNLVTGVASAFSALFTDEKKQIMEVVRPLAKLVVEKGVSLEHMSILLDEATGEPHVYVSGFNATEAGVRASLRTLRSVCGDQCASLRKTDFLATAFHNIEPDMRVNAAAERHAETIEATRKQKPAAPSVASPTEALTATRLLPRLTGDLVRDAAGAASFWGAIDALLSRPQTAAAGTAGLPGPSPELPTFLGALSRPVALLAMEGLGVRGDRGRHYDRLRSLADATAILVPTSDDAGEFVESAVQPPEPQRSGETVYMLSDPHVPEAALDHLMLELAAADVLQAEGEKVNAKKGLPRYVTAFTGADGKEQFRFTVEHETDTATARAGLAALFPSLSGILGVPVRVLDHVQRKAVWYATTVGPLRESAVPAFMAWATGYGYEGTQPERPDLVQVIGMDDQQAGAMRAQTPSGVDFSPTCMADPGACVAGLARAVDRVRALCPAAVLGTDVFVQVGPLGTRLYANVNAARRSPGAAQQRCPAAEALEAFLPPVRGAVPAFPQSVPPESALLTLRAYFGPDAAPRTVIPEGATPLDVGGHACVTLDTWPGHAVCSVPFDTVEASVKAAGLPAEAVVSPFGPVPGMPELTSVFLPRADRAGTVGGLFDTNPDAAAALWGPATAIAGGFDGLNPLALRVLGGATLYVQPLDLVGHRRSGAALTPEELQRQFFPTGVPVTGAVVRVGPIFAARNAVPPLLRAVVDDEEAARLNRGPSVQTRLDAAWRAPGSSVQVELPEPALAAFAQHVLEEVAADEESRELPTAPVAGPELGTSVLRLGRALVTAADADIPGVTFPDIHSASSVLAAARALVDHYQRTEPGRMVDPGGRWDGLFLQDTHLPGPDAADAAARFLSDLSLRMASLDPKSRQARALRVAAAFLGFAPKGTETAREHGAEATARSAAEQLLLLEKMIDTGSDAGSDVHAAVIQAIRTLVTETAGLGDALVEAGHVAPGSPLLEPPDAGFVVKRGLLGATAEAGKPQPAPAAHAPEERAAAAADPLGSVAPPSKHYAPLPAVLNVPVDAKALEDATTTTTDAPALGPALGADEASVRTQFRLATATASAPLGGISTVAAKAPAVVLSALSKAAQDNSLAVLQLDTAKGLQQLLDNVTQNSARLEGATFVVSAADDHTLAMRTFAVRNQTLVEIQYATAGTVAPLAPAAVFRRDPEVRYDVVRPGRVSRYRGDTPDDAELALLRRLSTLRSLQGRDETAAVFATRVLGNNEAKEIAEIPQFAADALAQGEMPVLLVRDGERVAVGKVVDRVLGALAGAGAGAGQGGEPEPEPGSGRVYTAAVWDERTKELFVYGKDAASAEPPYRLALGGEKDAPVAPGERFVQEVIVPPLTQQPERKVSLDYMHSYAWPWDFISPTRQTKETASRICDALGWRSAQSVPPSQVLSYTSVIPIVQVGPTDAQGGPVNPLAVAEVAFKCGTTTQAAVVVGKTGGSPQVYLYNRLANGKAVRFVPLLIDRDFGTEELALL